MSARGLSVLWDGGTYLLNSGDVQKDAEDLEEFKRTHEGEIIVTPLGGAVAYPFSLQVGQNPIKWTPDELERIRIGTALFLKNWRNVCEKYPSLLESLD